MLSTISGSGCSDSSSAERLSLPELSSLPRLAGGECVAGSFGEPPSDVGTLVPPIRLVDAGSFLDGGTTWVSLTDSNDSRAVFCVTQDCFDGDIPFNSLYVGAKHADRASARLPLSKTEALMLVAALAAALENEMIDVMSTDIGESLIRENGIVSDEYREIIKTSGLRSARNALTRLARKKEFEIADRENLDARIATMTSIDINAVSNKFRSMRKDARFNLWSQLKPCLSLHIQAKYQANKRQAIIKLLGESESDAVRKCRESFDRLATEQYNDMLAYTIKQTDRSIQYLIVDFRDTEKPNFHVYTMYQPRKVKQ